MWIKENHRLGTAGAHRAGLVLGARHPGHLMACAQCERRQATTYRTRGTGDEHPHPSCYSKAGSVATPTLKTARRLPINRTSGSRPDQQRNGRAVASGDRPPRLAVPG